MNLVPGKAIVAVFVLITCPVILESCCYNSCGCSRDNDGQPYYDIQDMTMRLYDRTTYVELGSSSRLSNISFNAEIDANYVSMMEAGGFTAYACSPAPVVAKQKITSIVITSNYDVATSQQTIAAGDDLAELFVV